MASRAQVADLHRRLNEAQQGLFRARQDNQRDVPRTTEIRAQIAFFEQAIAQIQALLDERVNDAKPAVIDWPTMG